MDWELIKTVLGYLSGPIIGAIIGLFTNYLAIKMLFRPYYPKRIGKFTLPFTPGIVPKRKSALAKAIGRAVGEELFTKDDIKNMLCSEKVEGALISSVRNALREYSSRSAESIAATLTDEVRVEELKEKISYTVSEKLICAARDMNIGDIVAKRGKEAIIEKKASMGLLGAFLSDGVIDPILEQVKDKIMLFLDEEGVDTALPAVKNQISQLSGAPLGSIIDLDKIDTERLDSLVASLYESAVEKMLESAGDSLDICSVVEEKINRMSVAELEKLCLSVMKKELGAVVYLGGVIGFIIGIINIFI